MSIDRRFIFRLTLAALGMVMFCLFAFVGLGWVVRKHQDWLGKVMDSEKVEGIWLWYSHVAAGIASWDSDGDGYSDGLELWLESDPRKPMSVPINVNPRLASKYKGVTPFCGEWSHWWYQRHVDDFVFGWISGTQISVSGNHPAIVFRKKAGDPESSTLTVAANAKGELEFEVCFKAPVVGDVSPGEPAQVLFVDTKNGDKFWELLRNAYGWRGPTVPAKFCDENGVPLSTPPNPDLNTYLARPAEWEKAAWFLVERRRKGSGEGFQGCAVLAPDEGSAYFILLEWLEKESWLGDYDWQITSALKAPPQRDDPIPKK